MGRRWRIRRRRADGSLTTRGGKDKDGTPIEGVSDWTKRMNCVTTPAKNDKRAAYIHGKVAMPYNHGGFYTAGARRWSVCPDPAWASLRRSPARSSGACSTGCSR